MEDIEYTLKIYLPDRIEDLQESLMEVSSALKDREKERVREGNNFDVQNIIDHAILTLWAKMFDTAKEQIDEIGKHLMSQQNK